MNPGPIPAVDAREASRRLAGDDGALLVDVRERDEFEEVRAPGAVLVPMSELQARAGSLPDRPLLLICRSGSRSLAASGYLRSLGRDATNVSGGMIAWAEAGLPTRTGRPDVGEGDLPD